MAMKVPVRPMPALKRNTAEFYCAYEIGSEWNYKHCILKLFLLLLLLLRVIVLQKVWVWTILCHVCSLTCKRSKLCTILQDIT